MDALRGRTIHGYRLLEEVGRTGLSAVYRTYQEALGREVAVKVIRPRYANRPHFIRRFEGEAQPARSQPAATASSSPPALTTAVFSSGT